VIEKEAQVVNDTIRGQYGVNTIRYDTGSIRGQARNGERARARKKEKRARNEEKRREARKRKKWLTKG
jgi:hypothetical protein